MPVIAETIVCGVCGAPLEDALPSDDPALRKPCASCGSTKRNYQAIIVEKVTVRDGFSTKAKRPGEKRPHHETIAVPDHSISRDKLVYREQIIDRENDRYFERVTDYQSGEVIHECEEPLSRHLGHGADKKEKKGYGYQWDEASMKIINPTAIKAAGEPPKTILEFIGRMNTRTEGLSIAHMKSPEGWIEPGQTPDFDEYTLVLKGTLRIETRRGSLEARAGEAFAAPKGAWVRYSSPHPGGAEYVAVCVPAFAPGLAHRDED